MLNNGSVPRFYNHEGKVKLLSKFESKSLWNTVKIH